MYVSGQLFLTNGDLEYISKAYVHGASGKYKMSYDFFTNISVTYFLDHPTSSVNAQICIDNPIHKAMTEVTK